MFKCPFCNRVTKSLGFLKLHIRKHHRRNLQCPYCDFVTKNLPGLEIHCLVSDDEKHKALYYLLHKNARNTKVSIENLKKYKYLFKVGRDDK